MSAVRPAADPVAFKDNARLVLADPVLRRGFRGAMDYLADKRAVQFPDGDAFEALRALVLEQARALADLSDAKGKADARIERLQAIICFGSGPSSKP